MSAVPASSVRSNGTHIASTGESSHLPANGLDSEYHVDPRR